MWEILTRQLLLLLPTIVNYCSESTLYGNLTVAKNTFVNLSISCFCISVYLRVCVFPPFLFSLIFQLCALFDKCLNSFNNLYPHIYCVAVLHVIFNSLYLLYLFPQFSFKNLFLSVFFVYLTYTVPSSFTYYYYYWFQLFIIFVIYIYIDWFGLVWKYLHNTHIRIIP